MTRHRILVVDDDSVVRFGLCDFLKSRGYVVAEAATCHDAQSQSESFQPEAAVVDFYLPDGDALDLLRRLRQMEINIPIIVLTGQGSINLAVRAMQEGAAGFFAKPVELSILDQQLTKALEVEQLRRRSQAVRSRTQRNSVNPFLGVSPAIRRLEAFARRMLTSESSIMIQGETGSGKGVLANWIHREGPRSDEEIVEVNCAELSGALLESDLFGHRKGAFTGAIENKLGLLEAADRGTLFLDEIGDVDLQVQAKLLKVIEDQKFRRMGEVCERLVDVRFITATHRDLAEAIKQQTFREDLYYRINVISVKVPPLRERIEDIPVLARHLANGICQECRRPPIAIENSALEALCRQSWPGNIRELRNVLDRAIQFTDRQSLTADDLELDRGRSLPPAPLVGTTDQKMTLKELEKIFIQSVYEAEGRSAEKTARRLGIARSSLYNKLSTYGAQAAAACD